MSAAEEARRVLIAELASLMVADGAPADDAETAARAEADSRTDAEVLRAVAHTTREVGA
jgi:hypothetical protein